nr:RNA polymerase subunit [Wadden Sea poxvirus]
MDTYKKEHIKDIISKYIDNNDEVIKLLTWSIEKSYKYYIRNIINTKSNIEETKFDSKNNIGIEYSKDAKNKLSYRNKPSIIINTDYDDICNMIRSTSGVERDIFKYILFGIKCIKSGIEYNIDNIQDINYEKYFNILDKQNNIMCTSCKSNNTTPMMIQTRSSDEPPLVMHTCRDCKKYFKPPSFKYNDKEQ